jgi:hypothetical protein
MGTKLVQRTIQSIVGGEIIGRSMTISVLKQEISLLL